MPSRQPGKYAKCFNVLGIRTQHLPHNTWDKNKIKKNYSRSSFLLGVNLCNIWYIVKNIFDATKLGYLKADRKYCQTSTEVEVIQATFIFLVDRRVPQQQTTILGVYISFQVFFFDLSVQNCKICFIPSLTNFRELY